MTTPEGNVKEHLRKRIAALGGRVRFLKWIGRTGAPDTRVLFPGGCISHRDAFNANGIGYIVNCFVETKAKDGKLSRRQANEIADMRAMGEVVLVCWSIEEIDKFFPAPS